MAPESRETATKTRGAEKDLKKAFEELRAHSSFLAAFTSLWEDLEDHISSIHRSIDHRLRQLDSGEPFPAAAPSPVATPVTSEADKTTPAPVEPEADPRPELRSLCVNMDGRGLLAFINRNRTDLANIYKELNAAMRAAPDPAALVLDAMDVFYPAKRSREDTFDGGLHANRRSCICVMEHLHMISPEIRPAVRERANKLAEEWEVRMIPDGGQNLEVMAFLQLLVSYGIASDFQEDDLLDHLVSIAKKKEAIDLCRNLGLCKRMADLVEKLSSKGKQLDAVKFVYAFDLVEKFPPVPLLKAYVKESKRVAQEMRKSGTAKSRNAAICRELDQLRAVIKTIEEHKLESEYSPEILQKRATQLEQEKAERRHSTRKAVVTNSKALDQQQQANKRPCLIATAATVAAAQSLLPLPSTQPEFSLNVRNPYMGSTGLYDLTGNIHLNSQSASIYNRNLHDLGHERSTQASFLYLDPRSGSSLYDRSGAYASYPLSGGLPPQYNSPIYPEL